MSTKIISGVYLPSRDPSTLWDLHIRRDCVEKVSPHIPPSSFPSATSTLALPSLCHPHVHLDKPFLLSSSFPQYSAFTPKNGSFSEALRLTGAAKSRFTKEDMLQRSEWLIAESVRAGVTHMRGFVEVDAGVKKLALDVAKELKEKWKGVVDLQICAFAQDPVFTKERGKENRRLMEEVLGEDDIVEVLGTTPYVEESRDKALKNVGWAIELAVDKGLGLDFHLDYNLNKDGKGQGAILREVVRLLRDKKWMERSNKTVCIGHCTRATIFSNAELKELANEIREGELPVHFIGLPTSDLYMMGRPEEEAVCTQTRPRGTIQIPDLIKSHGINAAIGINNVGNAFTPWGTCDPLSLASLGVGLYHAGTPDDTKMLYECISTRARQAIGVATARSIELNEMEPTDILLLETGDEVHLADRKIKSRSLRTAEEAVWSPPPIEKRRVLFKGREI